MKRNHLFILVSCFFLCACSSAEKKKMGDIYLTDVKTKDTLFSAEFVDLNQNVEILNLRKKPNYKVGVLSVNTRLSSLSLVVPLDETDNLFRLKIPKTFLDGFPIKDAKIVSFSGNKMLDDYESLLQSLKKNSKDSSLLINGFVHGLYQFDRKHPGSGMIGYHIYEANVNINFSEFSKHFNVRSKNEWKALSKNANDVFSKELQRINSSRKNLGCKKCSPKKLLFQSSNSTIHSDVLKDNHKVVIFWATWCMPCKAQMKLLADLNKRKYADSPVAFFAVSSEYDEKTLFKWVDKNWKKYGNNLGFFHDNDHCMATNYNIQQLPTIIVFNKQDKLIKSNCNVKEVEQLLDSLLMN